VRQKNQETESQEEIIASLRAEIDELKNVRVNNEIAEDFAGAGKEEEIVRLKNEINEYKKRAEDGEEAIKRKDKEAKKLEEQLNAKLKRNEAELMQKIDTRIMYSR